MRRARIAHRSFMRNAPSDRASQTRGFIVTDILLAVLGTGGILLIAGYAALCDRI
jgi:hypothetical protein